MHNCHHLIELRDVTELVRRVQNDNEVDTVNTDRSEDAEQPIVQEKAARTVLLVLSLIHI